jgi:hypothetical protein
MLLMVATLALDVWGFSMIGDAVAQGDGDSLTAFDDSYAFLGMAQFVVAVPCGICWMVWQYRLARSVPAYELDRGPGWHAFSWIIPIANLWLPFQNIRDLWRRFLPVRARSSILRWWWAGWIFSAIAARILARAMQEVDSVSSFRAVVVLDMAISVVVLVSAVLAARIVGALTATGLATQADGETRRGPASASAS